MVCAVVDGGGGNGIVDIDWHWKWFTGKYVLDSISDAPIAFVRQSDLPTRQSWADNADVGGGGNGECDGNCGKRWGCFGDASCDRVVYADDWELFWLLWCDINDWCELYFRLLFCGVDCCDDGPNDFVGEFLIKRYESVVLKVKKRNK